MTIQILRFQIPLDGSTVMHRFSGSIVAMQQASFRRRLVDIWVESNSENSPIEHHFRAFGTGKEIPPSARYVGTSQRDPADGTVWHVYDVVPEAAIELPHCDFEVARLIFPNGNEVTISCRLPSGHDEKLDHDGGITFME